MCIVCKLFALMPCVHPEREEANKELTVLHVEFVVTLQGTRL